MSYRLLLLIIILSVPMLVTAEVKIENTSTYLNKGWWNWVVFIDENEETLNKIQCVEYTLHPTFEKPIVEVCDRKDKFSFSANGWGTFPVEVKIEYKNGDTETQTHDLVFIEKTPASKIEISVSNWSVEKKPGWWEWGVSIQGDTSDLDKIRCVEYTLHETFPNPVRTVCDRSSDFLLTSAGWGIFNIKIKLLLKDGAIQETKHLLRFDSSVIQENPIIGTWEVSKWKEPRVSGIASFFYRPSTITGELIIDKKLDGETYSGLLILNLDNDHEIVEKMKITVENDTVHMEGKVIEGRYIWNNDFAEFKINGNQMDGKIWSNKRYGKIKSDAVSFIKLE